MSALLGFVHRVAYATLLVLVTWLSCTMPVGPYAKLQAVACVTLAWPVATVGQIVPGWHGLDVFYVGRGCDFCSPAEFLWSHIQLGVPVFVALFYIPTVLNYVARRDRRLFRRLFIGSGIYVVMVIALFYVRADARAEGGIRIAAALLILIIATSAVAWSRIDVRVKFAGIGVVLLVGAWLFSVAMQFIGADTGGGALRDYIAHLFVLVVVVLCFFAVTWLIERGLDRMKLRRPVGA